MVKNVLKYQIGAITGNRYAGKSKITSTMEDMPLEFIRFRFN